MRRTWILIVAAAGIGAGKSPAQDAEPDRQPVVIGSKEFTENRLLAEMMAQLIEARTTIPVERRTNLGGTLLVFSALQNGEIDLYPEYTGTGWSVILGRTDRVSDHLRTYLVVSDAFRERYDATWLEPFGFNNTYVLAVTEQFARSNGIRTISDLVRHQKTLRAALSHEFLDRQDGYPGLASWYGLSMPHLNGIEHGLAYQAIESGHVDLIDTYSTDGRLIGHDLRLLEDDRGFFPPYDCAPLIRSETLRRYPELRDLLKEFAFTISDTLMRSLNRRVEDSSGDYAGIAGNYLRSSGMITGSQNLHRNEAADRTFPGFLLAQREEIAARLGEHVYLTGIAVLLSILVGVPLGMFLVRRPGLSRILLGTAGVIQTIPGLALIAVLIPVPGLGLGPRSAIVALFLYSLLPIMRNTVSGIRAVDPDLIDAAHGMGLTDLQTLTHVQLPLAAGTIMAGIRTATVIAIGIATLAAFVGAGGLGDPIITGLQLNDIHLILSGALPAALLAIGADGLLGMVERRFPSLS